MSFDLTQTHLFQFLKENQLDPVLQKETGQLYTLFNKNGVDVYIFYVITSQNRMLQLIAYLPYQLHEKTLSDVARMLHMLNKELDMPGFGMDETEKLMFYRSVLPCFDGKIEEKQLLAHIKTVQLACDSFMHAIGLVAAGSASINDFLKKK